MPQKKGKFVVVELRKGSEEGLALAKQILLAQEMYSPKLRSALGYYLKQWDDFTQRAYFLWHVKPLEVIQTIVCLLRRRFR